jgi:hypothetical protein
MWNYLTTRACSPIPVFGTEEIEPWHKDGQIWRRLAGRFPRRHRQPQRHADALLRRCQPAAPGTITTPKSSVAPRLPDTPTSTRSSAGSASPRGEASSAASPTGTPCRTCPGRDRRTRRDGALTRCAGVVEIPVLVTAAPNHNSCRKTRRADTHAGHWGQLPTPDPRLPRRRSHQDMFARRADSPSRTGCFGRRGLDSDPHWSRRILGDRLSPRRVAARLPLTLRDAHGFRQMAADGRALALVTEGNDKSVRKSRRQIIETACRRPGQNGARGQE